MKFTQERRHIIQHIKSTTKSNVITILNIFFATMTWLSQIPLDINLDVDRYNRARISTGLIQNNI